MENFASRLPYAVQTLMAAPGRWDLAGNALAARTRTSMYTRTFASFALYCSMRPRQASQLDPTTHLRVSQLSLVHFATVWPSGVDPLRPPWQAYKSFRSTTA